MQYAFYQKVNNLYPVPAHCVQDACDHAQREAPRESVGAVWGDKYYPLMNCHQTPEQDFMCGGDYLDMFERFGPPQAVIHSHPSGKSYPSKQDQVSQMQTGVPYGIVFLMQGRPVNVVFWGEGVPMAPMLGRPFMYGVYDCWATARDQFYRDFGIKLKSYARDENLLNKQAPDNYFMDYFEDAGFEQVDFPEAKRGDILLSRIFRGDKVNHCGYYMGDGTVLHHPFGTPQAPTLPRIDIVYKWRKLITHCMRHKSQFVQVSAREDVA